jgi:hypothetical protein
MPFDTYVVPPPPVLSTIQGGFALKITQIVIYDDLAIVPPFQVPSPVFKEGWSVWSPERFAKRFPVAAQLFAPFQPFGVAPSYSVSNDQADVTRTRAVIYDDLILPPQRIAPSTPPPLAWQAIFPERFSSRVRASLQLFQFMHWWKTVTPAAIIAQPLLRGTDGALTLLGSTASVLLRGTDAAPSLHGTDAQVTLLGTDAAPSINGKVG